MDKYFRIKFFDSDHGGVYDYLTKVVLFKGSKKAAIDLVTSTKSLWGYNYSVNTRRFTGVGGTADIIPINYNEYTMLKLRG